MGKDCWDYDWANKILKRYSHRIGVIGRHSYMGNSAVHQFGKRIWNTLVQPNNNVRLVLCGHVGRRDYLVTNVNDRSVLQIVVDHSHYKPYPDGNEGWLRLIQFKDGRVYNTTYSPYLDAWLTAKDDPKEEWDIEFVLPDTHRELHSEEFSARPCEACAMTPVCRRFFKCGRELAEMGVVKEGAGVEEHSAGR